MVSIVSEKLEKEYDHRIQQTLAELRDFYENQMKTNRAEFTRKVVMMRITVFQQMDLGEKFKKC